MMSLRRRYTILTSIPFLIIFLSTYAYRSSLTFNLAPGDPPSRPILSQIHDSIIHPPLPPPPIYKPTPSTTAIPIVDNFPLAASAHSAAELPPLPSWNAPPSPHIKENTPLFIGFTRNWRLLQQVVVSYITSGWPASDIYVVENTGVMDSNNLGLLSLQNPFFLNHTRLHMLGVNVLVTPTLLTFAQLQNFYISTSTDKGWPYFFWSHMDLVALSIESTARLPPAATTQSNPNPEGHEPWEEKSLYANCVDALRNVTSAHPTTGKVAKWASVFFSYDRLALNNVAAFKAVGGWDTMIPFYMTDCDMHSRLTMGGFEILDRKAGLVYDVGSSLNDLSALYRQKNGPKGETGKPDWVDPEELEKIQDSKKEAAGAGSGANQNAEIPKSKEEKEAETKRKTSALAALFVPHAKSESDSSSSPSPPKPNLDQWHPDELHSQTYLDLTSVLDHMQGSKGSSSRGRNTWQVRQSGGQGDPFYRDPGGFETGIQMTIEHGRAMFREKWGHRDCDIYEVGLRTDDAWKVEKDWE